MINLEAKTKPQELVKAYLEKNATETLIEKINNGVRLEKDGKQLLNKKTLDGFMSYANNEARKLAEKGANSTCVDDNVVYGWAMHYFEEDSIEGTLYNLDGTEYKPPKKETKKMSKSTPAVSNNKKEAEKQTQYSFFEMVNVEEQPEPVEKQTPTLDEILDYNIDEDHDDDEDEEMSEQMKDALEHIEEEKQAPKGKLTVTPLYQQYLDLQNEHPSAVVLMRLGDFYEVFGDNATKLAEELDLTLTSKSVGLPERIPMIGFPYHVAESYFLKINAKHDMLIWEKQNDTLFLPKKQEKSEPEKHWINETTYVDEDGIIHEMEKKTPDWIIKTFKNRIVSR